MKLTARLLRTAQTSVAITAALLLAACARNLQWDEEVLLNTGETIWVNKKVRYTINGQPGNPVDLGYAADREETTSFKYQGRSYTYKGDASLLVLAISPQKTPVLLANADTWGWYRRHQYKCVNPFYVMFVPDASGQQWTWPDRVEPWTYNLRTNLLVDRRHPSYVDSRYTMADKSTQGFLRDRRTMHIQKIDPLYATDTCKESN